MKIDEIIERELNDSEFKDIYVGEKERSAIEIAKYLEDARLVSN